MINPPSLPNRISFPDPVLQDLKASLLDSEAAKTSLINNFTHKKRILVLGYLGTGKSSLVLKFHYDLLLQSTGGPEEEYNSTLKYKNEDYLLQIVDFIGMDEYTPIYANKYGVKVDGYILVYSIENRKSFEYIRDLREKLRTINGRDVPCVLVGNKADLKDQRQVSIKEGLKVAKAFEVPFLEVSAEKHSRDYIKKVFEEMLKEILKSEIQESGLKRLKHWDMTKVEQLYQIFVFGAVLLICIGMFLIVFGVSNFIIYPETIETHSALLVLFVLNGFLAIALAVIGIYGMKKQAIDWIYVFKILAGFSLALDLTCAIIMIVTQKAEGEDSHHHENTDPEDRFIDIGPLVYILLGMLFIVLVILFGISCFAKEIFAKRRLATSNRFPLLRV